METVQRAVKPLCIDLFCGLGGWTRGFLAEGYECIGFDIERHRYPRVSIQSSEGTKQAGVTLKGGTGVGSSFNWENEKRYAAALKAGNYEWAEYPAQLVLQDVLTLHGSQFRDAACIVASPPCQAYSYMAMPWTRAKQIIRALRGHGEFPDEYTGSRTVEGLNALFDACFRIQRDASEAATKAYGCARCGIYHPATLLDGCDFVPRHIPLVVENVKGAQPWVGRAKAHFGSYYLWGDVDSVGGRIVAGGLRFGQTLRVQKRHKFNPDGTNHGQGSWFKIADSKNRGSKNDGAGTWFNIGSPGQTQHNGNPVNGQKGESGSWFSDYKSRPRGGLIERLSCTSSRSAARKAASAQIAEIPFELASWIARCFKPDVTAISQLDLWKPAAGTTATP